MRIALGMSVTHCAVEPVTKDEVGKADAALNQLLSSARSTIKVPII